MKLAKASQEEIDRLMKWLQARETRDDPPPPFMRVVFGYETLLGHCCDPKADTLEFSQELLAAKADKARLDWLEARAMQAPNASSLDDLLTRTGWPDLRAAIDAARND